MILLNVLAITLANLILPVFSNIQRSIPVCPSKYFKERDHNYPYVVYGTNPPQCYVASRQGPCGADSVLFARPNSHLGVCSCRCFLSDGIVFDDANVQGFRYCFDTTVGQTYVFDRSRGSCYRLGSQGPCPYGQILYKDLYAYDFAPTCVREDLSNTPTTGRCPPGTIYSELLDKCTDMNFRGNQTQSNGGSGSSYNPPPSNSGSSNCNHTSPSTTTTPRPSGKCPPGTIYSTLLNRCVDMNFSGNSMGWGSSNSNGGTTSTGNTDVSTGSGQRRCIPGMEIYSELLKRCIGMNFRGLSATRNQLI